MTASIFNCSIDLYSPTVTSGTMGEAISTFSKVVTVRAHKKSMRSEEATLAMAQEGSAIHAYRLRYRSDVLSTWKVVEGTKHMALIGPPLPEEFHRGRPIWMSIRVREIN